MNNVYYCYCCFIIFVDWLFLLLYCCFVVLLFCCFVILLLLPIREYGSTPLYWIDTLFFKRQPKTKAYISAITFISNVLAA